jgi:two-component system cell cycle response regulator DivK
MARILVVEDNAQNLKLATVILRDRGHEVIGVVDSEGAEAALAFRVPDLILMDLGLPGKDGYTLTRELRDRPATRDVPIVALSSFAMRGDREKAMAAGCTSYLTKPIRRLVLLEDRRGRAPSRRTQGGRMNAGAPSRGRWGRISGSEGGPSRHEETRILVVEDSASSRKLLQAILLRLGITLPELRLSDSVDDAIRLFTEWRPEVVFLDIELKPSAARSRPSTPPAPAPDAHDGVDLATLFLARNPTLRVVLCSATDPSEPRIRTIVENPRVQFVLKPVVASRIQEVLDAALAPGSKNSNRR